MRHVLAASGTILSKGYMLIALSSLASNGNVLATEGLFFFAEVLEPALRAHAIQLLNILPDRARVMDAWRSAATDPNEEVALMAVELLTYSGPNAVAELQALLDRGAFRNPSARGRARDMIIVLTRQPR